jgi:hypothetical protein
MSKFLIEVPHEGTKRDCAHALDVFYRTGSHYLTHADWGCKDGVHKSWLMVDVESKDAARSIVPAEYRQKAVIVGLNTFTQQEIDDIKRLHLG